MKLKKNILSYILNLPSKVRPGNKESLMLLGIGVLLMLLADIYRGDDMYGNSANEKAAYVEKTGSSIEESKEEQDYIIELEKRLEEILSEVEGIGHVKVMITSCSSSEQVVTKDISPLVTKVNYPEIVGVVVIAEGSGTGNVDYDIMTAIQVLFNIQAHKIKIMKMK